MPILPHAIKKLRVDARRSAVNKKIRTATKRAVKAMRTQPSQENLTKAFSALDRAAKKKIIHKSKADRIKSRLSKTVKSTEKVVKKVKKQAAKKK